MLIFKKMSADKTKSSACRKQVHSLSRTNQIKLSKSAMSMDSQGLQRINGMKKNCGFTLIELMVTVAIIGILASIAYPSYKAYIIKGNRAAAKAQMLDIANREQQFLLANRAYATKSMLDTSGYALPSEVSSKYTYDIEVGTGAPPSYTITFTAINAQLQDGNLTLDSSGVKTPLDKW